uniref:Uncharacterized protein n=1 Tax=Corethron hystrix TaxID=216773 RepID=A0A7S1BVT0_9STRA
MTAWRAGRKRIRARRRGQSTRSFPLTGGASCRGMARLSGWRLTAAAGGVLRPRSGGTGSCKTCVAADPDKIIPRYVRRHSRRLQPLPPQVRPAELPMQAVLDCVQCGAFPHQLQQHLLLLRVYLPSPSWYLLFGPTKSCGPGHCARRGQTLTLVDGKQWCAACMASLPASKVRLLFLFFSIAFVSLQFFPFFFSLSSFTPFLLLSCSLYFSGFFLLLS